MFLELNIHVFLSNTWKQIFFYCHEVVFVLYQRLEIISQLFLILDSYILKEKNQFSSSRRI